MANSSHNLLLLAQQAKSGAVFDVVLWVIVLMVVVLVLGIVLMQLRRVMRDGDSSQTQGLLLDDLRRLRDQGELSSEEYQRAVDALADRMGTSGGVRGGPPSAE